MVDTTENEEFDYDAPNEEVPSLDRYYLEVGEGSFVISYSSSEIKDAPFVLFKDLPDGMDTNMFLYQYIDGELVLNASHHYKVVAELNHSRELQEQQQREQEELPVKFKQEQERNNDLQIKLDLVDEVVIMMLDEKFSEPESEPESVIRPMMFSMATTQMKSNPTPSIPEVYISLYARHVLEGKREIGQVPSGIRDLVINKIDELK